MVRNSGYITRCGDFQCGYRFYSVLLYLYLDCWRLLFHIFPVGRKYRSNASVFAMLFAPSRHKMFLVSWKISHLTFANIEPFIIYHSIARTINTLFGINENIQHSFTFAFSPFEQHFQPLCEQLRL